MRTVFLSGCGCKTQRHHRRRPLSHVRHRAYRPRQHELKDREQIADELKAASASPCAGHRHPQTPTPAARLVSVALRHGATRREPGNNPMKRIGRAHRTSHKAPSMHRQHARQLTLEVDSRDARNDHRQVAQSAKAQEGLRNWWFPEPRPVRLPRRTRRGHDRLGRPCVTALTDRRHGRTISTVWDVVRADIANPHRRADRP